ncbi:unnamed protein product, partial [Rotaria sordida]
MTMILPILSVISPNTLQKITDTSYQLFIGEEELVARFLKAYDNQTIDLILTENSDDDEYSHFGCG